MLTFDVRYGKIKMAERNDLVLVHFRHASHGNVSGARAYVSFPDNDWLADTSKANDARTLLQAFDYVDWLESRVCTNQGVNELVCRFPCQARHVARRSASADLSDWHEFKSVDDLNSEEAIEFQKIDLNIHDIYTSIVLLYVLRFYRVLLPSGLPYSAVSLAPSCGILAQGKR